MLKLVIKIDHQDLSFILSLSNEDSSNIRDFILNVHYTWALPLKVAAIIYLVQVNLTSL